MYNPEPKTKQEEKKQGSYNNILLTYKNFNKWHRSCKNVGECRQYIYLNYLRTGNSCICDYNPKTRSCYGDKCRGYKVHASSCEFYNCRDCHDYSSDDSN